MSKPYMHKAISRRFLANRERVRSVAQREEQEREREQTLIRSMMQEEQQPKQYEK